MQSTQQAASYKAQMKNFLSRYTFTHFVTLATNDPMISAENMKRLLKTWDAMLNRRLCGKHWSKLHDRRSVWFAYSEKLQVNPHWHLLMAVDEECGRQEELAKIDFRIDQIWCKLKWSGTTDVQPVTSSGALNYVLKDLSRPENIENFVVWNEFAG
jgi:hypothetical protein